MEEKYLPIGSVVTVKDINKKLMIIGYYSLEYKNSVKLYDYVGCSYPEGMLLKNNTFSFNHSDIISCDFLGYQDESFKVLNSNLNSQQNENQENLEQPSNFLNLKFDENGVVIYNEMSNVKKTPEIVKRNVEVANPFETKTPTETPETSTPVVAKDFTFDENGVVTQDNTIKENKKDIESNFRYTFDENGFVIGEEIVDGNANETSTSEQAGDLQYLFDENGFVVGEKNKNDDVATKSTDTIPKYTFDENGIVTGDSTLKENVKPTTEQAKEEPKKDEFQMPHYRFDENGVIISE